MHTYHLTGVNTVTPKAVSRKASIHAGSTGLTGVTGIARAHTSNFAALIRLQHNLNKFPVRMEKTLLTLLAMFKASIHAGFSVTGLGFCPVNPRKRA
jgi:hypothetical protein